MMLARSPLLVLVSLLLVAAPLRAREKEEAPKRPHPAVIEAWKEAGFEFGCLGKFQPFETTILNRGYEFQPSEKYPLWYYRHRIQPKLPAFRLVGPIPPLKQFRELPEPDTEFALCFNDLTGQITVEWLTCLSKWKNKLTGLDLWGTEVDLQGLEALAGLELTWLNLGHAKMTPQGWKRLSGMKSLKGLVLPTTKGTDEGLTALEGLQGLEVLELGFVEKEGLKTIGKLENLTELSLGVDDGSRKGLEALAGLENLRALKLWAANDAALKELPNLKNLSSLVLHRWFSANEWRVTDEGVEVLARRFPNLSVLNLMSHEVSGKGLEKLTDLRELNLSVAPVTDEGLEALGGLKNLTRLDLTLDFMVKGTKVTAAGLEHLKKLENLIDLRLGVPPIPGDCLRDLAKSKKLQRLEIEAKCVTDDVLRALRQTEMLHVCTFVQTSSPGVPPKGIQDVERLSLRDSRVTDAGLREIRDLTSLTDLDLANTQVTDAGLKELEGLKNLTQLDLTGTQVTDEGIYDLQDSLPDCKIKPIPTRPRRWRALVKMRPALVEIRRWSLTTFVIASVAILALGGLGLRLERDEPAPTPGAPPARRRFMVWIVRAFIGCLALLLICLVLAGIAHVLLEF